MVTKGLRIAHTQRPTQVVQSFLKDNPSISLEDVIIVSDTLIKSTREGLPTISVAYFLAQRSSIWEGKTVLVSLLKSEDALFTRQERTLRPLQPLERCSYGVLLQHKSVSRAFCYVSGEDGVAARCLRRICQERKNGDQAPFLTLYTSERIASESRMISAHGDLCNTSLERDGVLPIEQIRAATAEVISASITVGTDVVLPGVRQLLVHYGSECLGEAQDYFQGKIVLDQTKLPALRSVMVAFEGSLVPELFARPWVKKRWYKRTGPDVGPVSPFEKSWDDHTTSFEVINLNWSFDRPDGLGFIGDESTTARNQAADLNNRIKPLFNNVYLQGVPDRYLTLLDWSHTRNLTWLRLTPAKRFVKPVIITVHSGKSPVRSWPMIDEVTIAAHIRRNHQPPPKLPIHGIWSLKLITLPGSYALLLPCDLFDFEFCSSWAKEYAAPNSLEIINLYGNDEKITSYPSLSLESYLGFGSFQFLSHLLISGVAIPDIFLNKEKLQALTSGHFVSLRSLAIDVTPLHSAKSSPCPYTIDLAVLSVMPVLGNLTLLGSRHIPSGSSLDLVVNVLGHDRPGTRFYNSAKTSVILSPFAQCKKIAINGRAFSVSLKDPATIAPGMFHDWTASQPGGVVYNGRTRGSIWFTPDDNVFPKSMGPV